MPELGISPEKVCYVIVRARQFQAKVAPVDIDEASNMTDDGFREILEDFQDDPVLFEARQFIDGLDVDETANLVALAWLGRGDYTIEEWDDAVAEARDRQERPAADYLMGTPLVADYLEAGLDAFGESCDDFEEGRL